jgi:hypothetical protein
MIFVRQKYYFLFIQNYLMFFYFKYMKLGNNIHKKHDNMTGTYKD